MTLLDRFRTTAPHKHPDASVRLAFVEEVPLDERDLLAEVAREDEDPRVRRAAVGKLLDPAVLYAIAQQEQDEAVRGLALEMLRDIALESFEGIGEAESLAAVEALEDPRTLAQVAKGGLRESTALRALARIDDARTRGSVARHAALDPVRRAALDALDGLVHRDEIVAVAMNSEFRDSALAALERLNERADLEQVATRAQNKSASKRARIMLNQMDEEIAAAEAARVALAEADAMAAARQAAEAAAAVAVETPADVPVEEPPVAPVDDTTAVTVQSDAALEPVQSDAAAARDVPDADAGARQAGEQARAEAETEAARRREDDEKVQRENLGRLRGLVARADALAARPDLTLKAVERALRDVRAALDAMPPLPTRGDHDELSARLSAAQTALSPKALELREAAEWRRWANAGIQEQLCGKMEALASVEDPAALVTAIRDLQTQWRAAADVPRAQADALWRRFKTAHDALWPRCEEWLAAQTVVRAENLARKVALCERVEALVESTNWLQTAEEIKKLQAEWKTIGAASRGQEKALWQRFRSACDRFFTRRHEDLVRRKATWAENLAKKEALCAQAEALAESTDWEAAAAEIKRMQAEWKTIGPVKKTRSEAIWQRFRAACDAFFTRYAHRHDTASAERIATREAICAELEGLVTSDAAEPPAELAQTVRALHSRWHQELAARGLDRDRAARLDRRFAEAMSGVVARWPSAFAGSQLDPDANRSRLEALCKRVEGLAASASAQESAGDETASPATRLAAMLKEALASNTIGGKVDEGARWRAAAEEVRQAQAAWTRVGPVADEVRRPLAERFDRACRFILGKAGIPAGGRQGNKPSGVRQGR
jgi:Domain of Unknown Function (DUF349)